MSRILRGRDGLAVTLSFGAIAAGVVALLSPHAPTEAAAEVANWRFNAANAALLAALGALLVRPRPGMGYLFLGGASFAIAGSVESAWQTSLSFAQFSDVPTPGNPAYPLLGLSVLARTAVPAAILTLYATDATRRLGRWVAIVGWGVTILSIAAAFLRVWREVSQASGQSTMGFWHELSFQLDEPIPLLAIATLGFLGGLRATALAHVPTGARRTGATPVGPSRLILAAVAGGTLLWLPATIAFLNRAPGYDDADNTGRVLVIPILAALIAVVAERWSRIVAWAAMAVTFEAIAFLVIDRAAADYVTYALSLPEGSAIPTPVAFILFTAGATGIVALAFAAVSVALGAAWADPTSDPRAQARADRSWAVRGGLAGLAVLGWFFAGSLMGAGFALIPGAAFLPMFVIPFAVGLAAWRRLLPAVAEAERLATEPFRPLRYLETVISESLTRSAEHRRLAVDGERERLGSELNQLQEAMRAMLADGRLVLEPTLSGAAIRNARPPSGRRRPSDREIDVISLLAGGASNEEIARNLVLSVKTVETHLRRLFNRYDVTNRTELAVLAVRERWVDPS